MKTKLINSIFAFSVMLANNFSCKNIQELSPINNAKVQKTTLQQSHTKLSAITPIIFNEGLSTVYRGIRIPKQTTGQLGINNGKPGYFRVREFRVAGQVNKKAIVLSILKHYGENVNPGESILPASNEPWVFSNFVLDYWSLNMREVEVKDNFGHKLKMSITLNTVSNCWVTVATISNLSSTISTQTYTTQVLNTCSFVEPIWTVF